MRKGNVVIAGTYPPPIGGVTIHTIRLKRLLDGRKYTTFFIDIRPTKLKEITIHSKIQYIKSLIFCLRKARNGVLHYQLNNWIEASLLAVGSKFCRAKVVYTVHSFRNEEFSYIKQICFRITSKLVTEFIAPSLTTKKKLILNGINASKVRVLDTYLPPPKSEFNLSIPSMLEEFINRSNYIILANASRLFRDTKNTDVYGLDMCIDVCARMPEVCFVFCVPIIEDEAYLKECKKRIKALGIDRRFIIYNNDISLVSLLRYVNLFVRPTSTDSFGISIVEALSCNIPVIASDVCNRAKGTILFNSRNTNDFLDKIKQCKEMQNGGFKFQEQVNYIEAYEKLYDELKI